MSIKAADLDEFNKGTKRAREADYGTRPARRAAPPPAPDAPQPGPSPTRPDEIRVLLNAGKASKSKRIQSLANKVFDQLDQLRLLLDDETKKARARAEVDRLEAELAAARARLHPSSTPTTAANTDSAAIRAWARENDVPCPRVGRVPAAVREAYETRQAAS